MIAVFDTNILVDYLRGIEAAKSELTRFVNPRISVITWAEVLVGAGGSDEESALRGFLSALRRIPVDEQIADEAVRIRRTHRLKLPDAIIWATARCSSALLVTRNTKEFPADDPSIRVPYAVGSL